MPKRIIPKPDPAMLERRIHVIRGQRVMLDSDRARPYGLPLKRLNGQVRRNRDRFPDDFCYQLTQQEFTTLKLQIATSKPAHGSVRKLPWVLTEHGVPMLSRVLPSPPAVHVNIAIIRTIIRLRRLLARLRGSWSSNSIVRLRRSICTATRCARLPMSCGNWCNRFRPHTSRRLAFALTSTANH